jgi:hypothetical protein
MVENSLGIGRIDMLCAQAIMMIYNAVKNARPEKRKKLKYVQMHFPSVIGL